VRKRLLKSLLCAVLSLSIVFPCAVFSPALAADSEIPVYFNGEKLVFDVPAQIIGDRTMVPLRAIFEAMGATVTWDPVTRTATGVRGDTTVVLPIGSLYPTINGIVVPLDVPAQIVDDRTLAPLRFVGEAFGGSVEWDEVTRSAHIAASDNVAELAGLSPVAVDFSLAAADLSCCRTDSPSNPAVRPGIDLTLKAKVYKNTPDAASGTVVFTLADSEVDRVPFAMDASDDYVTVKTYAFLNFDDFAGLTKDDTITSSFQAEVIPGDANYETNDADNTASKSVSVTGADIEPNENPAAAAVTLKTVGDLGENLTMPGEWLALKANVTGGNGYYTRVLFYVDGRLVGNKQCYVPKNGDPAVSSFSYFVPWSASGSLDLRVELEDGALTAESTAAKPCTRCNYLVWKGGRPADFELPCEFKLSAAANSGHPVERRDRRGRPGQHTLQALQGQSRAV
jgi:hypothetical protein